MRRMRHRGWPRFWLTGPHPFFLWDGILCALAALFVRAAAWRWRWATPYHVGRPLICIGNFTVGGGGKTPLTMLLAQALRAQKPAILSRGYGGRARRPVKVEPHHDVKDVGDEALMMATMLGRQAPVYSGVNRRLSARAAIAQGAGLLLMDDGMQNPALVHALNLATVDAAVGLGNGRVLPAGPLRRPWELDLARADAVIVMKSAQKPHRSLALLLRQARAAARPIFHVQRRLQAPRGLIKNKPLYAFCGLARPEKFFAALRAAGWQLAGRARFADHHAFTAREARRLLDDARTHRAQLVTTAKDMARLQGARHAALRALAETALAFRESLRVQEETEFWRFVRRHVRR